jgi:capsular exopolysaccharide synthesis family protein
MINLNLGRTQAPVSVSYDGLLHGREVKASDPAQVPAHAAVDSGGDSKRLILQEWDSWNDLETRWLPMVVSDRAPFLSNSEDWSAAEQYRMIRTKLLHHAAKPRMIAVTSPGIGDGKTVTAINLAAMLARNKEAKVLLIDADLRRSTVHKQLGIESPKGLAQVLSGSCRIEESLWRVDSIPNLYCLPAGDTPTNPTELLDSERWRMLCQTVRKRMTHVLIDCPPVGVVADYDLISSHCDGSLLVLRPDHTERTVSLAALEAMREKLLGVVLNGINDWFFWRKTYPRYYGE